MVERIDSMILVNLESLSTSELRNLSQQEMIDDFENMDRDELISCLMEKYEEENSNCDSDENIAKTVNVKNINSLSDNVNHTQFMTELPGTEELPSFYEETSIHFLYKNCDWGYVFWSISSIDMQRITENNGSLILVVTMVNALGNKETYDILINDDDRTWNIGFSKDAVECFVSLVVEFEGGKRDLLVQSDCVHLPTFYWLEHTSEMKENDPLFKVYLSLITTKTGEVITNSTVQEIIKKYRAEDCKV